MGEFRPEARITRRVNARVGGLKAIVHQDAFEPIILDAHSFQIETVHIRRTASPGQNLIHDEFLLFSPGFIPDNFTAAITLDAGNRRVEAQRYPLTNESV